MKMPTHIIAVGGIVENENGKILLVKTINGGWVFPGGQVEVGENLVDALAREVKEESGVNIEVGSLLSVISNTGTYKWYDGITDVPTKLMLDFVCKYKSGELCTSEETTEVCWVKKDEVLDVIQHPAYRTRYQNYIDFAGTVTYMEYVTKPEFQIKINANI